MSLSVSNQYILLPQQKLKPFDLAEMATIEEICKINYDISFVWPCARKMCSAIVLLL